MPFKNRKTRRKPLIRTAALCEEDNDDQDYFWCTCGWPSNGEFMIKCGVQGDQCYQMVSWPLHGSLKGRGSSTQ